MEKDFYYTELFEIYKDLLTEKQKDVFYMHIYLDLSLNEIAEEKGITRQNVSDTIKNVRKRLDELEKILNVKEKNDKIKTVLEKTTDKKTAKEITEIINK